MQESKYIKVLHIEILNIFPFCCFATVENASFRSFKEYLITEGKIIAFLFSIMQQKYKRIRNTMSRG